MISLDRFTETSISEQNNMSEILVYLNPDNLVIGSTCTFVFTFDNFSEALLETLLDIQILYKESLAIKFIKTWRSNDGLIIDIRDNKLFITSTLTSEETKQFKFNRSASAQAKFILDNNEVLYGDIINLTVISTLDNQGDYNG